jgi:hypothetical protein
MASAAGPPPSGAPGLPVTKTNFEAVADNMKVVGGSMAAITASGKEFFQVTTATARHWQNLAISTSSVAKNILGATESLIKWSGILSLVTGGAGLFGFDRLAQSVSSQRMAAGIHQSGADQ